MLLEASSAWNVLISWSAHLESEKSAKKCVILYSDIFLGSRLWIDKVEQPLIYTYLKFTKSYKGYFLLFNLKIFLLLSTLYATHFSGQFIKFVLNLFVVPFGMILAPHMFLDVCELNPFSGRHEVSRLVASALMYENCSLQNSVPSSRCSSSQDIRAFSMSQSTHCHPTTLSWGVFKQYGRGCRVHSLYFLLFNSVKIVRAN